MIIITIKTIYFLRIIIKILPFNLRKNLVIFLVNQSLKYFLESDNIISAFLPLSLLSTRSHLRTVFLITIWIYCFSNKLLVCCSICAGNGVVVLLTLLIIVYSIIWIYCSYFIWYDFVYWGMKWLDCPSRTCISWPFNSPLISRIYYRNLFQIFPWH